MAKLSEIIDHERQRTTPESMRQIRLWAEGNFYRAYEWSAWLCVRYIRQFKVTKRYIKSVKAEMVFVGFPKSSLEKFYLEGAQMDDLGEIGMMMTLPEGLVHPDSEDSTLEAEFNDWKTTVALTGGADEENEKKDKYGQAGGGGKPMTLTAIMRRVMEYQVEQHSPIDCMMFLAEVKQQLSALL